MAVESNEDATATSETTQVQERPVETDQLVKNSKKQQKSKRRKKKKKSQNNNDATKNGEGKVIT